MIRRPRRFWMLYAGWTLLCVVLFFSLRHADDPSRPRGLILSIEAGRMAEAVLRAHDPGRFREYRAIHVARGRPGEGSPEDRWVVLLDRTPPTNLREAIVVELGRDDGRLLRIRRPPR